MQTIEVTAKKVDVAIREGLAKLNAKLDDVNVEILSQGGLFKKAKVRITLTTDAPEEPTKADKPRAGRPAPAAAAGKDGEQSTDRGSDDRGTFTKCSSSVMPSVRAISILRWISCFSSSDSLSTKTRIWIFSWLGRNFSRMGNRTVAATDGVAPIFSSYRTSSA